VLGLSAVILVTGLYEFVVNEYEDDLGRTYPELAQDSYVYDEQGKKIGEIPAAESRETVGRPGFGEHLPQAVVVVEDRRFYEHFGVDFEGLGRAAWTDLRAWEVQEGGGTISEQVRRTSTFRRRSGWRSPSGDASSSPLSPSPTSRTIRKNRSSPPT
jgi:membrane peptidoglycan carboxypeptidase